MAAGADAAGLYERLAEWEHARGAERLRDRYLLLAADAALTGGRPAEAERLRRRLLELNPHHLLRPFATFAEAVESPDVGAYLAELRQSCPPQEAERLLDEKSASGAGTLPHRPSPPGRWGPSGPNRPGHARASWSPENSRPPSDVPSLADGVHPFPQRQVPREPASGDPLGIGWVLFAVVLLAAIAGTIHVFAGPWLWR
ncbi:MAG: hypothetical protein NZ700_06695 [Gemmataceae bacterium]|nr:hypothetical protein [Gemmataceae bacterium]MDW8264553.1 hypothetical protein [Gemmataceae bacterium]